MNELYIMAREQMIWAKAIRLASRQGLRSLAMLFVRQWMALDMKIKQGE